MSNENKWPCEGCQSKSCKDGACERWKRWFPKGWDAAVGKLRAYLWKKRDDLGKQRHRKYFYYVLPHEQKDPCEKCVCAAWCDTPCSLRLHWWDITMVKLLRMIREKERKSDNTN
jgi:hypothetical protein